ncbi:hypothetical protein TrVGV298_001280 [Trichoderma virens]|nr:hypothetical protein TrVGV298_001280 [Trichoderma virens]
MPFFEAPDPVMQNSRNTTWSETISKKNIGGARSLWGDYWKRFNTMQIPMFGVEEYFNTAKAIAEIAVDEKDFEKLFMERNKQRQKELMAQIKKLSTASHFEKKRFPCWSAQYAAIMVCQTGCFEHFLSLLQGNVLGWEADSVEDEVPNNIMTNFREEQKFDDEEMQDPTEEDDYVLPISPSCETQIFTEYDWAYASEERKAREKSIEEKEFREKRAGDIQEITSSDDDINTREGTRRLLESSASRISRPHGSFSSHRAASRSGVDSTVNNHSHKRQRVESPATKLSPNGSIKQAIDGSSKKRSISHGDDDGRGNKRRKTQSPVPALAPNASSSVQQTTVESTEKNPKKRVRFDGDDGGDDHEHKRRRTHSPAPTLPPNGSSIPQTTVESLEKGSKKRSRSDDVDVDHGNKRQKTQTSTSDMTPHLSSSPQQAADGNVVRKGYTVNGAPKSWKRSKIGNPKLRPLRRSTRRSGTSTFQELDSSGKPRPIR